MNNGELGGFTRDDKTSAYADEDEVRDLLRSQKSARKPSRFLKIFGGGALAIIGLIAFASYFAGDEPECGSGSAKQLVVKIAREKMDNSLASRLFGQNESYQSEIKQSQRRLETMQQQARQQAKTNGELGTRLGAAMDTADAENMSAMNKALAIIMRDGSYSLDTVRTDGQNSQTKAVACSAKLTLMIEGHTAEKEIRYKIEKTSDGQLYATVFGLGLFD